MKKSLILSICLLSLFLIFNCSSARKKIESENMKKTGNIAGIVLESNTGQPLSGVTLSVEPSLGRGARSDTLGRFWISNVSPGEYTFLANKIPFSGTKVSHLKVVKDSTSIVVCRLCSSGIPEWWWCWSDWTEDRKVIKTDSVSFFSTQNRILFREK